MEQYRIRIENLQNFINRYVKIHPLTLFFEYEEIDDKHIIVKPIKLNRDD